MTIDKNKLEQWGLALAKGSSINAREVVNAWNEIFTKGLPRRNYTTCVSCLKRMLGDILRYYRFQEQQTAEEKSNETETEKPIETDEKKPIEEKTDIKPKIGRKKKSS